jgi:hypothetical protein
VDGDRQVVLDREPAVTRDVICVRVRLEHPLDAHALGFGGREQRLDLKRRVDHHCATCGRVADEIRGAPEIVVDELPEKRHER